MIIGRPLEKVIDIVSEILAMAVIVIVLLMYINSMVSFLDAETLKTMTYVREVGLILVLGAKASEFALKRSIFLFIPCAAIIIAVFVLIFIPGTVWLPEIPEATEAVTSTLKALF